MENKKHIRIERFSHDKIYYGKVDIYIDGVKETVTEVVCADDEVSNVVAHRENVKGGIMVWAEFDAVVSIEEDKTCYLNNIVYTEKIATISNITI